MNRWYRAVAIVAVALVAASCGTRVVREGSAAAGVGSGAGAVPEPGDAAGAVDPGGGGSPITVTTSAGSAIVGGTSGGVATQTTSGGGAATRGTAKGAAKPTGAGGSGVAGDATGTAPKPTAGGGSASARPEAGGTATGSALAGPPGAAAGSKSPIKIAVIGTLSGPAGSTLGPIATGVQVWTRFINDTKGGLNGHHINLTVVDDGGDPARHRAQVQEQVERQGVIAFVGNPETLTGKPSQEYLTSKSVPVVGSETASQYFYESPMYFPQASSGDALLVLTVAATADRARAVGKKKYGLLACTEAQFCRDLSDRSSDLARRFGMEPVYNGQTSLVQPDFTAQCLAARNAGVDVFQVWLDANSVARVAGSCTRQNYRPTYVWGVSIQIDRQKNNPNLDGGGVMTNVFPYFQDNTPATAEFHAAMTKYAPSQFGIGAATGWTSAKLFEKAAAQMPEPPTSQAVLDGLWTVKNDTLGGLTQPLTFTKNQPAKPKSCWFNFALQNGTWLTTDGFKLRCL